MNEHLGNLLDVTEGIIVHGCNARGVMGAGVAKAVRARYPQAYADYRKAFESTGLKVGQTIWTRISMSPKLAIANAITQQDYGRNPMVRYVDYNALRQCFEEVGQVARKHQLSVHYPRVGAALGGGEWSVIAPIIEQALQGVDHHLWTLPEPQQTPGRPRP